jgi:hypothetical protein
VRWWKTFREDFDRPGFQLGIERFGTSYIHDVGRVWQLLCVEDGPGIREVALTTEMLAVLARQFRVDATEASARLEFMANVSNLIDIGTRRGSEVRVIFSKELKNRRDEWSRKVQKAKGKSKPNSSAETPESRRRNSGTEAEAESKADAEKPKSLTTGNALTTDELCSQKVKSPWEYCRVVYQALPKKFRNKDIDQAVWKVFGIFQIEAHNDGKCNCSPVDFIEDVRGHFKQVGLEYPPAFLAQQVAWETIEHKRCQEA